MDQRDERLVRLLLALRIYTGDQQVALKALDMEIRGLLLEIQRSIQGGKREG